MNKIKTPAISPGEVVREELTARGWTQQQFADVLGKSRQFVNAFLRGKSSLTFDVAFRLEAALDVPADTWLRMEREYRTRLERSKYQRITKAVSERARRLDSVAEGRKRYGQ
jgi:HTH-type transcriptional regulator/antitoxin HigA